ncbi:hypothetical protein BT93_B1523 [Corymbia citriodora subsp. variegata]|nr:hypothetical protein BT93_B1523 [Corymbia citriodora subsp. variegata]
MCTGKGEHLLMGTQWVRSTPERSTTSQNWTRNSPSQRKLRLYPDGKVSGLGAFVSLYLVLAEDADTPPVTEVFADFSLRITDQLQGSHKFSPSSPESGWARVLSHATFYYPNMGTLVKDTCMVDAEVTVLGVANAL